MTREALAVIVPTPDTVEVGPVGVPDLGPRDVLIRTLTSGVSTGTDKWVMQGRFTWMEMTFPVVPGYQRFGVVEQVGSAVIGIEVGQEVVATESTPFVGAFPAWGGHVSLAATDAGEVYDATGLVPERAALVISGQVGYNAASRILGDGDHRVVVYGDGIIGSSAALAARARGFDVLLVGRHPERLEPVAALGIETVRGGDDSAHAVSEWRPTVVIDTVHNDAGFDEYIDLLPERTGQIVFSGHSPDGVTAWADMTHIQKRELTVSFVSGWTRERIEATLGLMRDGSLPLELLAGPHASGASAIADRMREVAAGQLTSVAAVLDWRGV